MKKHWSPLKESDTKLFFKIFSTSNHLKNSSGCKDSCEAKDALSLLPFADPSEVACGSWEVCRPQTEDGCAMGNVIVLVDWVQVIKASEKFLLALQLFREHERQLSKHNFFKQSWKDWLYGCMSGEWCSLQKTKSQLPAAAAGQTSLHVLVESNSKDTPSPASHKWPQKARNTAGNQHTGPNTLFFHSYIYGEELGFCFLSPKRRHGAMQFWSWALSLGKKNAHLIAQYHLLLCPSLWDLMSSTL